MVMIEQVSAVPLKMARAELLHGAGDHVVVECCCNGGVYSIPESQYNDYLLGMAAVVGGLLFAGALAWWITRIAI